AYLKSPGTTELIRMFVKMGRVDRNYKWKETRKGIPQGGVISPLLANFYLYPLDKLMVDHGYGFVRYADDFIILGRTEEDAKKMLQKLSNKTHKVITAVAIIDKYEEKTLINFKKAKSHLEKIIFMAESDKYCIDIITQTSAVKQALSSVEDSLMESHLGTCVVHQIKKGKENVAVDEILKVYRLKRK
ncbi:MAG: metal-sensing transcriptional repressor, partial [bacterium]